jgi:hypothetical protein
MIEVKGQYIFSASIDDIKDFIQVTDLISFEVDERCGNIPPMFKLNFRTNNDKILTKLNEKYPVLVQFGENLETFDLMSLYTSEIDYQGEGDVSNIFISGFALATSYTIAPKYYISEKQSGISVLKSRLAGLSTPVFNTDVSNDSQHWIQYNIPDRPFFNQLIAHSYSENSFFMSAIRSDNKFVVKDAKKESSLKADNPDWIFSRGESGNKIIPYAGDYSIKVRSGLLTNLVGYGRERVIYEIEKGTTNFVNQMPSPLLALTKQLAKNAAIEKKYTGSYAMNDNVHKNYYKAYLNFLVNNVMLGAISTTLSFSDKYRRISPLDWVMFKNDSKKDKGQAHEYISGFYIVARVVRQIINADLTVRVELCRESFNRIKA